MHDEESNAHTRPSIVFVLVAGASRITAQVWLGVQCTCLTPFPLELAVAPVCIRSGWFPKRLVHDALASRLL